MRGTPSELPESYVKSSPITYAADVAAPILVIQFCSDTRTPAPQMQAYSQRMRQLGKDFQLEWFEGGHQSFGPELFARSFQLMRDFAEQTIARHRKGKAQRS